jgi:hypothetical protein
MDQWHPRLAPILQYSPEHIIISRQHSSSINKGSRQFSYTSCDPDNIKTIFAKDRNLYEVLPYDLPRRFAVDIDIKPSHHNYNKYNYDEILNATTEVLNYCLSMVSTYTIDVTKIITSVVRNTDRKQSMHILYPIYFENQLSQYHFAKLVHWTLLNDTNKNIEKSIKVLRYDNELYFDPNIYSKNQNLRMIYQTKKEYPNYPFEPYISEIKHPYDYLTGVYKDPEEIPYFKSDNLEPLVVKITHKKLYNKEQSPPNSIVQAEYRNIIQHFEEYSNLVVYEYQTQPNYDTACQIEFYISCIPNSGEKPQSYQLWYSIGQTLKNLTAEGVLLEEKALQYWFDWSNKASSVYKNEKHDCKNAWDSFIVRSGLNKYMEPFLKKIASYYNQDAVVKYNILWKSYDLFPKGIPTGFDKYSRYNEKYCKYEDLKESNLDGILIDSGMGTGKTYYVKAYAKKNKVKRLLIISPRKSFSYNKACEFREIFEDVMDYTELKGAELFNMLKCNKLAIQFESLVHLSHITENEAYDLVILDEIESILYQVSSSTNGNNSKVNFETMMKILTLSKKFVLAEAIVLNRSINFALELGSKLKKKILYSVNEYKNKERTAIMLGKVRYMHQIPSLQNLFLRHIIQSLKANKKICIAVASKAFKRKIISTLSQEFGEEYLGGVKHYDADSGAEILEELRDVNAAWGNSNVRVILYTTKITVGIDFSLRDVFDCCYVYGMSTCPIARDLIQSHYRVRHLKEKTVYVALCCCTEVQVEPNLENETKKNNFIDYKFEIVQNNELYKYITDFNSLEEQLGYYAYEEIFLRMMEKAGYNIKYDKSYGKDDTERQYTNTCFIENYMELIQISDFEVEDIKNKVMSSKATSDEILKLQAYNFHRYIIRGFDINKMTNEEIELILREVSQSEEKYTDFMVEVSKRNMPLLDAIITTLFNLSYYRRDLRESILNLKKEACYMGMEIEVNCTKKSVKATQRDVMRGETIKRLCNLLEVESSVDWKTKIDEDKVISFYRYYEGLPDTEKQIFDQNFNIPPLNAKEEPKRAKQLINLMLKSWNGCGFDRHSTRQVRMNGVRKRFYEYNIICHQEVPIALLYVKCNHAIKGS